jgi:CheY-like chemotaxis protein
LLNLLGNALKFTEKGSIDFSINKITINGKETVRFSITDTGIGIKEEYLSKIFFAFTQADSSTTKKYGGTGLGLAISSKLLSLMQSKLEVKSVINEGSQFYFDIPLDQFNMDASLCIDKISTETKELELLEFNDTSSITIMLVEDNKVNMFLLKAILYDIIPQAIFYELYDGQQAVDWVKTNHVDLIYMDIQMPIKNGYESAQEIRLLPNGNNIPIIAITASAVQGEKEKCLQAGMSDYITKPIISSTIEQSLTKWLPSKIKKNNITENNLPAHIDVEKLTIENNNNGIYLKSIFPYVKESLEEGLAELKQLVKEKDIDSISIVAHRIKGTALTASFTRLAELCKIVEFTKIFEDNTMNELMDDIETEINYLLSVL